MRNIKSRTALLTMAVFLVPASAFQAQAQSAVNNLTVEKGYSVKVFAKGVPGQLTAPDSIAVTRDRVYIGYGDGHDPAGLDGKKSQIVEYTKTGQQLFVYNVLGHNDGLKVEPCTGKIWAMQNEDANPNLVIIDPATREQTLYTFAEAPPHGGGYDDIVFRNDEVYFSASNPANNPNTKPAIVRAKLVENTIEVEALLEGDAQAKDVVTGTAVTLNLQDPDSMTLDTLGDIVLDSQADSELVLVRRPGSKHQSVLQIPLSSPFGTPQVDDTLFTPAADGFILVSDTLANTIYAISTPQFAPGLAYSGGVGAPAGSSGATTGFVARLDLQSGYLTPIVSGLKSPHGMAFVLTNDSDHDLGRGMCER
jgi:hypothetical protein